MVSESMILFALRERANGKLPSQASHYKVTSEFNLY